MTDARSARLLECLHGLLPQAAIAVRAHGKAVAAKSTFSNAARTARTIPTRGDALHHHLAADTSRIQCDLGMSRTIQIP